MCRTSPARGVEKCLDRLSKLQAANHHDAPIRLVPQHFRGNVVAMIGKILTKSTATCECMRHAIERQLRIGHDGSPVVLVETSCCGINGWSFPKLIWL